MTTQFWIDRWSKNEIGFHQPVANDYLSRFWPQLDLPPGAPVFVPLCGKSLDMHWLRERGHPVIGVELAHRAVADFFQEWGVEPQITQSGPFEHWRAHNIEILRGDFFDLEASDLEGVRAVFDRAALIALPQSLRQSYATRLRTILPFRTRTLLVTLDYAQTQMSGPPFAVGDEEVRQLFAGSGIRPLAETDITDEPDNARYLARGLTRLVERVYVVQK